MPSTIGTIASSILTPLKLGAELWLDASDASTVTASGSPLLVSQWNDKSGNGLNFTQGTEANQPTTGATTQNSLNVLSFSGNQALIGPTSPNLSEQPIEIFVAGNVSTTGTWFSQTNESTVENRQFQLFKDNIESVASRVRGNLTTVLRSPNVNRFRVSGISWKSSDSTLLDGNTGNVLSVGAAAAETDVPWRIGARGPGIAFPLNGTIGEVILFRKQLTAQERSDIIQYIAKKWNITL
jgi:hypothetical protein